MLMFNLEHPYWPKSRYEPWLKARELIHGQYAWDRWLFGSSDWPLKSDIEITYGTGDQKRVTYRLTDAIQLDIPYLDLRVLCASSKHTLYLDSLAGAVESLVVKERQRHAMGPMRTPNLWIEQVTWSFASRIYRAVLEAYPVKAINPYEIHWPYMRPWRGQNVILHSHQREILNWLKKTGLSIPILWSRA